MPSEPPVTIATFPSRLGICSRENWSFSETALWLAPPKFSAIVDLMASMTGAVIDPLVLWLYRLD